MDELIIEYEDGSIKEYEINMKTLEVDGVMVGVLEGYTAIRVLFIDGEFRWNPAKIYMKNNFYIYEYYNSKQSSSSFFYNITFPIVKLFYNMFKDDF